MRTQDIKQAFDKAETAERALLTRLFAQTGITDYTFTAKGSSIRYDFEFTKEGNTYFGDIKCRALKHNAYSSALIDKSKIDFLIEEGVKLDKIPMIICAYTDDVVLTWYLLNQLDSMKTEERYCNRTTAISNAKKMKAVCLLEISKANKTTLNDLYK